MKPFLTSLKIKDYITLTGVIMLGFGWLLIDQLLLSEVYQRFIALIVLLLGLFYLQFQINKPKEIFRYAHALAFISFSFISVVSIIMHVIINHDFTYKSILIWIATATLPYLAGFIYSAISK
jgi:hypothetical protein